MRCGLPGVLFSPERLSPPAASSHTWSFTNNAFKKAVKWKAHTVPESSRGQAWRTGVPGRRWEKLQNVGGVIVSFRRPGKYKRIGLWVVSPEIHHLGCFDCVSSPLLRWRDTVLGTDKGGPRTRLSGFYWNRWSPLFALSFWCCACSAGREGGEQRTRKWQMPVLCERPICFVSKKLVVRKSMLYLLIKTI